MQINPKRHLIILLLLIFTISIYGQNNDGQIIDSLKKQIQLEKIEIEKANGYNKLCKLYSAINKDSAIFYGNKAMQIYSSNNAPKNLQYQIHYNLGVAYLESDIELSRFYLEKSLASAKNQDNDSILAANYLVFSTHYSRIPKLDSSIYYNILATDIFQELQDSLALAYCYYTLMSNYNDLKNIEKTLEYGLLCYDVAKKKNIEGLISHVSIALGFTYTKIEGEEILANKYINEAKELAKANNNYLLLSHIYLTLGAQKFKIEKYQEAINDYNKAFQISMDNNDELNASRVYYRLGIAYYKLFNYEKSAFYFKKDLAINRNTNENNKNILLHLSFIYANKDIKQHALYLAKYDSLSKVIDQKKSEELLIKYETSEKEREIEILKVKEIENKLIIQKKNFRTVLLYTAIVAIGLIFSFLYYRYRNKQKFLTQKISLEKQKVHQKENEIALKIEALKNNRLLIDELKDKLKSVSNNEDNLSEIVSSFEKSYVSEKQWDNIILHFSRIEKDFISDLEKKYSNITKNDIKLSILTKLNYSNSGMAEILNITIAGVKKARQRLKKKLIIS